MTMPFTHKKDEVRATGTLEARTPGDQAVQVLLYVIIALVARPVCCPSSMWWPAPLRPSAS